MPQRVRSRSLMLRSGPVRCLVGGAPSLLERLALYWSGSLDEAAPAKEPDTHAEWRIAFEATNERQWRCETSVTRKRISFLHPRDANFMEVIVFLTEALTKLALASGTVWLHASSFEVGGSVVLVAGPKGCGKTHWLVSALIRCNARFLGNEQIPLESNNDVPSVRRWRPDIRMDVETLRSLGVRLPPRTTADRTLWLVTAGAKEALDIESYNAWFGENAVLFPPFEPALTPLGGRPVSCVVLPRANGPGSARRISPKEALLLWNGGRGDPSNYFPGDLTRWEATRRYWTNIRGLRATREGREAAIRLVERLFSTVPVYYISDRPDTSRALDFLSVVAIGAGMQ